MNLNKNHPPEILAKLKEARKLKKHGFKIIYIYAEKISAKKLLVDQATEIKDRQTIKHLMAIYPIIN
jgi:uncharacterized protein YpiB (UPF0302 family)